MTRYLAESKNHEPIEREFDDRDEAIEWAVGMLEPDRPRVQLFHRAVGIAKDAGMDDATSAGPGGWERVGIYDHDRGSA